MLASLEDSIRKQKKKWKQKEDEKKERVHTDQSYIKKRLATCGAAILCFPLQSSSSSTPFPRNSTSCSRKDSKFKERMITTQNQKDVNSLQHSCSSKTLHHCMSCCTTTSFITA
jgi:hypothetical protein